MSNLCSVAARKMDIRVLWDDDQVLWHSPPYTASESSVTAEDDDDLQRPSREAMFKMLVRQSECRYGTTPTCDSFLPRLQVNSGVSCLPLSSLLLSPLAVLNFQILEHHKLKYVAVAGAELGIESFCSKAGQKSLSIPLYKVTAQASHLDDSSVKAHNPAPLGVRFGTLYLTVTTKLQQGVYRWFWLSLINHLNHTAPGAHSIPSTAQSTSPASSPRSGANQGILASSPPPMPVTEMLQGREGLIGSGEILHSPSSSPPPRHRIDESLLPPLTSSGTFPDTVVTSENLQDMILLLGIETSDEEFEEMCAALGLERPWTGKSPVRGQSDASASNSEGIRFGNDDTNRPPRGSSPPPFQGGQGGSRPQQSPLRPVARRPGANHPEPRPHISMDEFLSHFTNILPRRGATPHASDHPVTLATRDVTVDHLALERHETSSIVNTLFLGHQLDHDEYIWESALVNDRTRITHLVVDQELRPSAQLLQTADASYDTGHLLGTSPTRSTSLLSSSPPSGGVTFASLPSSSSPPPFQNATSGQSLLRSSLSSAYGFFSRFSGGSKKERRKDLIYVQDRETGKVVEEKMPQYLRRMLRGMYSNPTGRQLVNQGMSKSLLKRMTFNQAKKYTAPASTNEIPDFIAFHNIDANEFLDPISSFANFNDFFIRKLRQEVRPITSPDEPAWAICPADCRLHVYETLTEAQNLWIKGKTFSLKTLLSNTELEADFAGCSLVIARLAPQDYHRFHYPVSGFSGKYFSQGDAYYTVNPIAVRENVDVYSLNKRTSVIVDSPDFGKVMIICIGATMVGSVVLTSGEDVNVEKGDELGYFQFGGSTLLVLFQRDRIRFDDDLIFNSAKQQETLVKMGMSLGRARRSAATSSSSA